MILPRAILFDFYGTLADPAAEDEREAVHARTAAALGVDAREFDSAMRATFPARMLGHLGDTEGYLRVIAERLGADEGRVAHAAEVHRRGTLTLRRPHPAALATLRELRRRGIRTAVVSDCTSDMPETWQRGAFAGLVDATVFSCEQGYRKPDPRMYLSAAEALGVPIEECWFVGDGGSREHWGARRAGAFPILIRNIRYPSAAQHRDDVDAFVPELAVDELDEVLGLLDAGRVSS